MANSSPSTKLSLSALDFDGIKSNIISYLQSQQEFTDYSFAGSGLQVILNILAYNTTYLSFYLNMVANEMFLDSASRRENVVSIAKQLGYVPTSRRSAQATINLIITPPSSPTPPAFLTIPTFTTFNTSVSGTNYTFVTTQPVTVPFFNNCYTVNNLVITEGVPYNFNYTVSPTVTSSFVIPNSGIDTTTLNVGVQQSSENTLLTSFSLANSLITLTPTSNVFFIQEVAGAQYEVYFGDGILGVSLVNGNIVYISFIACNGTAPNLANVFTLASPINGYSNVVINTVNPAQGGAERQNIDSIRFLAPQFYQTQNRVVTVNDYQTIISQLYPNVGSVAVWGGETENPPQYGKVFLSLRPISGYVITEQTKQDIISNILSPYNIVSIIPTIVDPYYINLIINSIVKYNAQNTNLSENQLQVNVLTTITNFGNTNVGQFGDIFRYTQLTGAIDATDPSITNDLTTVQMQIQFTPLIGSTSNYSLNFANNVILPGSLSSGSFVDITDPNYSSGQLYYFNDDGNGNIREFKYINTVLTYVNLTAGTINYAAGTITLNNFNPASIPNTAPNLKITVQPQVNDIVPAQNTILL